LLAEPTEDSETGENKELDKLWEDDEEEEGGRGRRKIPS
jgi:hypothetical protein